MADRELVRLQEAAAEPREAKSSSKPMRPATPPSCAAQQKSGGGAMGKRLFGIVGDNQSEWQPLVRESNQVMPLHFLFICLAFTEFVSCKHTCFSLTVLCFCSRARGPSHYGWR